MTNETNETNENITANFDHCTFTGVEFDKSVVGTMSQIAEGLTQNARGLTALAEVLSDSNIHIETMIKVDNLKDYRATEK